jgi:hypothetical protein
MTAFAETIWGPVPSSYIKTITITRTKSSGAVDFYDQGINKYTDHRATQQAAYQSATAYLETIPGVLSVSIQTVDLVQTLTITVDTFNTTPAAVLQQFDQNHPGVSSGIQQWNTDNAITTTMTVS